MRKRNLTNEKIAVSYSNAHRVVGESTSPTAEEVHSAKNEDARFHTAEVSTLEELHLFTASEAAKILHVSRNAIYALWRDGQLDFWRINGTMTTNLTAIRDFLERAKNADLPID